MIDDVFCGGFAPLTPRIQLNLGVGYENGKILSATLKRTFDQVYRKIVYAIWDES